VCFDVFYKSVRNISHYTKNGARYDQKCILVFTYSARYACQILMKLKLPRQISEKCSNIRISNFMKIRLGVAELFHADLRTDMVKPIVAFRSFANAPRKQGERKQLKLEE
jgi:hypothetical protein